MGTLRSTNGLVTVLYGHRKFNVDAGASRASSSSLDPSRLSTSTTRRFLLYWCAPFVPRPHIPANLDTRLKKDPTFFPKRAFFYVQPSLPSLLRFSRFRSIQLRTSPGLSTATFTISYDADTDPGFLLTEDTLHLATPSTATTTDIDILALRHPTDVLNYLTGDIIGQVLPVNSDVGAQNAVLCGVLRDLT
ncbi:hypothetical protein VNI00_005414 [Paramarasmius palmivorus]|uniref:Uncharacterized protein n=1 Tax=Paramarasmius palmivorus TaxID=297713 RepID=A0AAW0DB99_9AGAR